MNKNFLSTNQSSNIILYKADVWYSKYKQFGWNCHFCVYEEERKNIQNREKVYQRVHLFKHVNILLKYKV